MVKYRRLTRKSNRARSRRVKSRRTIVSRNRRGQRRYTRRRLGGSPGRLRKTLRRAITGNENISIRRHLFGCAQPQGDSSPTEQEHCANRLVQIENEIGQILVRQIDINNLLDKNKDKLRKAKQRYEEEQRSVLEQRKKNRTSTRSTKNTYNKQVDLSTLKTKKNLYETIRKSALLHLRERKQLETRLERLQQEKATLEGVLPNMQPAVNLNDADDQDLLDELEELDGLPEFLRES